MMIEDGILSRYWRTYGGFKALFSSAYFYAALILSALMAPAWLSNPWHETVLAVMPNILGFSLGGYALLVAVGDENFRALISGAEEDGEPSPFMEINASFVHFILMQLLSIIVALFAKAYYFELDEKSKIYIFINEYSLPFEAIIGFSNYIGYAVFIYALLTAIAATLSILRVSSWYDHMHTERMKEEQDENKHNNANSHGQ